MKDLSQLISKMMYDVCAFEKKWILLDFEAEETLFWNETMLFPSTFLVNTGWFLILEKMFRNDYIAACSTALRSATEENESAGHVDVRDAA